MKPFCLFALLFSLTICSLAQTASTTPDAPTLFQKPSLSTSHIVFVYAGDLWIVPRTGGDAKQLTNGVGVETNPVFSPDGATIAFTGHYDGNTDVFTILTAGGVPKRLTFHPGGDSVVGWTNDGKKVLFSSSRDSANPTPRLFTMAMDGTGLPDGLLLPMAERGSYSPDGAYLAYEPFVQWQPEWKKYRGGQQDVIWIAKLSDSTIEKLPRNNSIDKMPMFVGDKVYFLSDRSGGVMTLFAFDTKTKKIDQVMANSGLDIKYATAGPGAIVYEQFGAIFLHDLKTNKSAKVNIRVNADLTLVRPRFQKVGTRISNARLSPTGARAVFEARGEILTVPAEKGDARNLTKTPGAMDRDAAWSPDGKWIAYFSDEAGEYALHLSNQTGMGDVKKISLGNPPSYFYSPVWSPDSKKIALTDKRLNLWFMEIEKNSLVKVDTNTYENPWRVLDPSWSPDSKWLTYTKQLKNRLCAVFVHSLETNKSTQITDGLSDTRYASFDKNGKYLYFTASTDAGPSSGWLDMSSFPHNITRSVYVVVLKKGEASPLAPESDEEKIVEEKKDAPTEGEKKPEAPTVAAPKPGDQKEPPKVTIDFENIHQRILSLPIPARNFIGLEVAKPGIVFLAENTANGGLNAGLPIVTLHKFDLEKRKLDKFMEGVNGVALEPSSFSFRSFALSANGDKILFAQGFGPSARFMIAPTMMPMKPGEGALNLSQMEVFVDPRAEWKQMYNEAWRIQRDFMYDPNLHGLDYQATKKKYEPWLAAVGHRDDLNYLFDEMLNHISVGHHFIRGGETPNPNFVSGGLLGCDYKIENGRYRIAKIYNGENWNPGLRAPLTQPGIEVKEGEYLLAVNGRNLTSNDNVYAFFEATAGKQIVIRVGANPDGSGARNVTVVPLGNEFNLRNREWIDANRRRVEQLSGGKLAYVYLPDTGGGGYTNFNRYYFSQIDKEGAVMDERFNGGGTAADYIIDNMKRPLMNKWVTREGEDFSTPANALFGPKAMIINEFAGSGGDMMPWLFRKAGVGPLVGKRTWGGLVGIYDYPVLMDGGTVTAPRVAFYNLQGEWDVENKGTAPDIEVENDPALWRQGKDPQLEKAVEILLEELKKNPRLKYQRPTFPNYNSKGVVQTEPKTNN